MSGKGFSKRAEKFKKLHNFRPGDGSNSASPVPNSEIHPVPSKIVMKLGDTEVDCEPDDLQLIEMLGHGMHGHVDKMMHRPTSAFIAVKTIPWKLNSGDETVKLKRELDVSLLASSCPHVVKCYGALYKEGSVWICMEVMNTSLEKFYETVFTGLPQYKVMPESFVGRVAYCVVSALHYLKTQLNVIHRDVKPSNILINRDGVIKICDFGISGKLVDSLARSYVGSRNYMAPEKVYNEGETGYDITSDVWSLGISLIEIATGVYPYNSWKTPFEHLEQVVKGEPPHLPPGQFSAELEDFLHKCLQKDPRCRSRYEDLLQHPFITQHMDANISEFVAEVLDKQAASKRLPA